MGHIQNAKGDLVPLIDRLNKYPVGLVDNEKLREILSILFSEEEVYVASRFPLEDATLEELTQRTDIAPKQLLPILEHMADKGLVMDLPYGDQIYYLLMPGLIGFFEFTFMKNRTDLPMDKLARLMGEYLYEDPKTGQASEFFGSKTPLTRSLLHDDHIPVSSEVTTSETAKEIIRNADFGAVSMCYCRHRKQHAGGSCKKGAPVDGICISLGRGSEFLARRGFAEKKTKEELLAVIDLADELHLTHITDNVRHKPSFICNCCGCCCELVRGVQVGYHDGIGKTPWLAWIDPGLCDYCGECFQACNVGAIGLARNEDLAHDERYSAVRNHICLGCGACISACEKGAIQLVPRDPAPKIPHKKRELYRKILTEKKRLAPWVRSRTKKLARSYTANTASGK
jgi:NAD-dependent dihydropyrimidine dehydrogenase PreA subunit